MPGALSWAQQVQANYVILLPHLIIVATLLFVMLADLYLKQKRLLVGVAVAGVALAMVGVYYAANDPEIQAAISAGQPLEFWGKMIVADGFTLFMNLVILGIAALVLLLSTDYVECFLRGAYLETFEVILAATLGMMFMVSSRDLVTIYIGLELASISSYVLAGLLRKDPKSNEAALKYFLNGTVASAVLLFGISILFGVTGSTRLPDIALALMGEGGIVAQAGAGMMPLLVAGMIFVAGGFAFKVAAAPMHLWAPDVYEGSPTPVTGFFSVGPKGAAFGALLRVFVGGLGVAPFVDRWTLIWAVAATASMFIGNLTALLQTNVKRMMAYSSIAQAGYILVGVAAAGLETGPGVASVLFYTLAYALTNLGIFAVLTHLDQEGVGLEVDDLKGLVHRHPIYAWAMLLFLVSLIGIPPTVGFMGKLFLFKAAAQAGYLWLALIMAVNSVISVGYYYRLVRAMFLEQAERPVLRPSAGIATTLWVSLAGVLVITVLSGPVIEWTAEAALLLR